MNGNELYHYGVPGMRWGVRRAKSQLSNITGRDKTKISDAEATRFRKDVKTLKKLSTSEMSTIGNAALKAKHGKKYADAVVKQAGKEKVKNIVGKTAAITAGTIAAGFALMKLNKKVASSIRLDEFQKTSKNMVEDMHDFAKNNSGRKIDIRKYAKLLDSVKTK